MTRVAHIPYLEKRPSGFFFRRRFPKAYFEIENPGPTSALCLSLRTDVLSEATCLVRALTALTDLAVALTTERPVDHLSSEHVTLLTELARFQIAAHEAVRASANPRSEGAANFAAKAEHTTQEMLRRALALGDRTPAVEPLRQVAQRMGVSPDETSADWRKLAFEALRVMLDVSRERERREVGTYEESTPIFRSVMASHSASPTAALPALSVQTAASALVVPAVNAPPPPPAPPSVSKIMPSVTAPVETDVVPASQDKSEPQTLLPATQGTALKPQTPSSPEAPLSNDASLDDETAFRVKLRPPRLKNIDLRDLSPEMQEVLKNKPRGISLLEGIQLMKELKLAGYGDDFSSKQSGEEKAGKRWKSNSGSKANVCEKFWVEFVGDVPFEKVEEDAIRDAMKILPQLPYQHSKGTDKFVAKNGFRALIDELDAEEERAEKDALKALGNDPDVTEADREKARLDARIPRLRAETRAKHRGYVKSVGKMLYDLQLIDQNPFEICGVTNKKKAQWKKDEAKRKRICWDDRIFTLFGSPAFQGPFVDPGDPFYWVPLLARLMGLREEEACQLGPDDFGTDGGIAYLDVKVLDGNNVKTLESQRRLPVHPILIELGLLRLVELRRRASQHRLFPNLTRGKTKGTFSENFTKNWGYYRKKHVCYWEGLDLHAMRTSFNSDLMNRDKSDAIRCVLMGHDPVDEGARSYSQGLKLETLYERICDVELDVSMIAHPFGDPNSAAQRGKVVGIRSVAP
ncbi:MAG: hypothetical protein ABJN39_18125 [Sulfitobacter sp.]|uniref:hypothetical protein n=1 Tax=unclassified Sulfitobacter TaxID=196795 RepID=UPI002942FF47|nr:hypothetical protein [Sulfitobacter sp. LC.270.F.C4]WOI14904.1 hypothetical protein R1T45_17795 [Sulfitobacter sp. LC.270.F.C4]